MSSVRVAPHRLTLVANCVCWVESSSKLSGTKTTSILCPPSCSITRSSTLCAPPPVERFSASTNCGGSVGIGFGSGGWRSASCRDLTVRCCSTYPERKRRKVNAQMTAPEIATEMAEEVRRTIGAGAAVVGRRSGESCCYVAFSAGSIGNQSAFLCRMMQVGAPKTSKQGTWRMKEPGSIDALPL